MQKQSIIDALRAFARQRPGLEFGNYGDVTAYRAEMRQITKDLEHAQTLLRAVEMHESITADDLVAAFDAYSGRLSITETKKGVRLEYVAGQYFPTEYRRAVCAVACAALWAWFRDQCGCKTGDDIRKAARREFPRGIASRWFN